MEEEDLEYMKGADASLMSDEESGGEDKGMYVVLPPRWRSARQRCQLRLEENGRLGWKPASL